MRIRIIVLETTNTQHIIQKLIIWETNQAEKTVHGIELDIKKRLLDINRNISKTKDYWNKKETLNFKFGTGVHQQEI